MLKNNTEKADINQIFLRRKRVNKVWKDHETLQSGNRGYYRRLGRIEEIQNRDVDIL